MKNLLVNFPSSCRWLCAVACVIFASGCAANRLTLTNDRILRLAQNVPKSFAVDASIASTANAGQEGTCYSPMIDPRDQTHLRLVRSAGGYGDYEVPPGRYGVGAGELLRLDCKTGQALGVVRGEAK